MKPLSGFLLGSAALLASCSAPKPDDAAAAAVDVKSLNQQFIGAWNAKNTAALDTLLADDVQYAQGATRFNGKSEVSDKWVRATLGTIADLKLYGTSTGTDANTAYEAGTFSTEVLPEAPGQPSGEGEGNFILLWKKNKKNAWKLSYVQLEGLPVKISN
ncbi:ketosteroid isomerase-like protein [Hymenobacter luteus]|uniref:Ketosteroid isomerase-like protein n=2 Tax=Hymenobacter TaxID=89966 RepID=A0A7W9WEA3_9BACT|nr:MULTISPECIES: nuclear transport factor 2 family protein [Hymenobacter]MBB4602581.1 ketosteroid isomerase-like protein [Hymenobacter latericoloratus]MBB6060472.1 ketosteroid isomerase-like protein [Hymenobacter luteus]